MRTVVLLIAMLAVAAAAPAAQSCAGDADGDSIVTVAEVVQAVRNALDGCPAPPATCNGDADGSGEVRIGELVQAVNNLLTGCPAPPVEPRLIALSRDGRIAALEITSPWRIRASGNLGVTIGSARCAGGRCLVVHPSPADSISVVSATDLSVDTITLERGADPRDVALVDDRTAVVSQYAKPELLVIDLDTRTMSAIDLSPLADRDGVPEALMMVSCGRRVFIQLRRIDRVTEEPASIGAALAVVDLDQTDSDRVIDVDPTTPGVQGIALAGRPNFDMPVDCAAGRLHVAEPAPVLQGGGDYEQVDLKRLIAGESPIDMGAEVGGFEVVEPGLFWLITHTDFGPGASSHLSLIGGPVADTHNTFAGEHVNDLALDREEDLLFFPDPCTPGTANQSCDNGIHVFHAHTGARASTEAIDLGFPPIEVVVSR